MQIDIAGDKRSSNLSCLSMTSGDKLLAMIDIVGTLRRHFNHTRDISVASFAMIVSDLGYDFIRASSSNGSCRHENANVADASTKTH